MKQNYSYLTLISLLELWLRWKVGHDGCGMEQLYRMEEGYNRIYQEID
jgi:hypothetical protein